MLACSNLAVQADPPAAGWFRILRQSLCSVSPFIPEPAPLGVAAGVLQHLLPIDAGRSPETLRHHTLRIGAQLGTATSDQPTTAAAAAITVSVDSTFIRSREEGERHLEVRVGNVETASGGRQVFGAVAKADTDISALIRQSSSSRWPNRRH